METHPLVDSLEQRKAPRFPLEILVELERDHGLTRNVSIHGMLFISKRHLAQGEKIWFFMHMGNGHAGEKLACQGTVVRVEPQQDYWAMGVNIEDVRFGG